MCIVLTNKKSDNSNYYKITVGVSDMGNNDFTFS